MIVVYQHDHRMPDGEGRAYRELEDGTPFTWYAYASDPRHRRAVTCIATSLTESHPDSARPYDRRLAVELETGQHHWLAPETPVVTSPLRVVAR